MSYTSIQSNANSDFNELESHVMSEICKQVSRLKTLDTYFPRTLRSMKEEQGKVNFIKLAKMAQEIMKKLNKHFPNILIFKQFLMTQYDLDYSPLAPVNC